MAFFMAFSLDSGQCKSNDNVLISIHRNGDCILKQRQHIEYKI